MYEEIKQVKELAESLGWKASKIYEFKHERGITNYYSVFDPQGNASIRTDAYSSSNEWPEYELDTAFPSLDVLKMQAELSRYRIQTETLKLFVLWVSKNTFIPPANYATGQSMIDSIERLHQNIRDKATALLATTD